MGAVKQWLIEQMEEEMLSPQPHTFLGKRGDAQVSGITLRQLYEIVEAKLPYYDNKTCDPDAFCQDMCVQIEKLMGTFPNLAAAIEEAEREREFWEACDKDD